MTRTQRYPCSCQAARNPCIRFLTSTRFGTLCCNSSCNLCARGGCRSDRHYGMGEAHDHQARRTIHIPLCLDLNPFVHPHVPRKRDIQPPEPYQLAPVPQHCSQRRCVALKPGNERQGLLGATPLARIVIVQQRAESQMNRGPSR